MSRPDSGSTSIKTCSQVSEDTKQTKSCLTSLQDRCTASLLGARIARTLILRTSRQTVEQLEECEGSDDIEGRIEVVLTYSAPIDVCASTTQLRNDISLDPSTVKYLPEAIRKLSRYHRIALNLAKAAPTTRLPHLRKILSRSSMSLATHTTHEIPGRGTSLSCSGLPFSKIFQGRKGTLRSRMHSDR